MDILNETINKKKSASSDFYKAIIDNAFEGVGVVNAKGKNIYQSPAVNRLLGYEAEERIGKSGFELMHPDDLSKAKEFIDNILLKPGATDQVIARIQHKKGHWVYLDTLGTNFLHDPSVNGIVLNYRDITDKMKADAALAEGNRLYKTLVDTLKEGVLRVDNDDIIQYANNQFCIQTGYENEELLGKKANELLLDKGERLKFKAILSNRLPKIDSTYELRLKKKNGEYIWLLISGSPVYSVDKKIIGSVGVHIDISARKDVELKLKESENKYHQLSALSPVGIFKTDLKGQSQYKNEKWSQIAGISMEESKGDDWPKAIYKEDRELVKREWEKAVKNQSSFNLEYRYQTPVGKITWVYGQAVVEKNSEGKSIGYIGTITDITEQKTTEQNNERGRKILEALATGESVEKILNIVVEITEKSRPGMLCSVLLLDAQTGQLRQGVAPNLPDDYNQAVDGLEIGMGVCSCGEAAYTGKTVIVDNIFTNPNWAALDKLALAKKAGLRACWSEPIFSSDKKVIGTLAMYFKHPQKPDNSDLDLLKRTAYVAGIAIERKLIEAALHKSEEENRVLLTGVPDMIFHLSGEGKYLGFSPGANTKPFKSPDKLIGNNINDVLPPNISTAYTKAISKALKTKKVELIEYSLGDWADKNKSIFFESRIMAIGDNEVMAMVRDVSERKQSEKALVISEQRNRALLEGVPEMIFQATKHGVILDYKPGSNFNIWSNPEDFIGQNISKIASPNITQIGMGMIKKALENPGSVQSHEYSLTKTENDIKKIQHLESRIIASNEDEVIILISDISKRKEDELAIFKSEEQLRISNRKLKGLILRLETIREEEKKIIAMEVHDELGQELTAMRLGMFWIKRYLEENQTKPDTKLLNDKTDLLIDLCAQTINSVRKISHQLKPFVLDNMELMAAIKWHINSINEGSEIKHYFTSSIYDLKFKVEFSKDLFKIIQESLTNISRHSKATEANVELRKTANSLKLIISDDGIGIKDNVVNQPGKLGLFSINERVKNWNGKFSFKNSNQKGTMLNISIPLKQCTL